MINSNINITSNIYIRENPDIRKDRKYTERITGAKKIRDIQSQYIGLESIPLTVVQERIASESTVCIYARKGEVTHGAVMVDGVMRWENRCENMECKLYETCVKKKIVRKPTLPQDTEEKEDFQKMFESFGIRVQDDIPIFERDRKKIEIEEQSEIYTKPSEQKPDEIKELSSQYTKISSPDCVIQADIDSHIILNSGAGTGKTYTIIQRLIYILENELCPADEVYILCYTRSAKKVIENEIDKAITKGILEPSAQNICVLTFDSYASYFLMNMKEEIAEDFSGYDYNQRIALFNQYISEETFEGVRYFIIDEIQDLVNERAKMVLNILHFLKCGYLLAGDRCQSIYDYEADSNATLDSVKFYALMEKEFPDDIQRYEIIGNRRQSPELAMESDKMRQVLLNEKISEQNRYASQVMKNYFENITVEKYIKTLEHLPEVPTAILCRNNGEAEYISGLLCEKKIPHFLNRGVNHAVSLPRWIADVFWDYCLESISKNDFIERFQFRCGSSLDAEMIWKELCNISDSNNPAELNMSRLISALSVVKNIPSNFYPESPLLTVSTIHKAKGSEFDRVILIDSNIKPSDTSAEEARVRYVALTRPKNQLIAVHQRQKYFKRTMSGRVIETGLDGKNLYKRNNTFCKGIAVGWSGDIDNRSFVSGEFEDTIALQEYLIHQVHLYDKLTAKRSLVTNDYEIFHNGKQIGSLSREMLNEIDLGISATDYRYNLPASLENLYVSEITTEILKKFSDKVPMEFQKSKICFGIQITGLARLNFEKR
ncbi:MAG: ATP-dependent helicase [Oscillospiraceae bacterium]